MTIGIVIAQTMGSVATVFSGYLLGRMYSRKVKSGPSQPVCMCKHGYNCHKDGRKCQVDEFTPGRVVSTCACILYIGPDPVLSGLWHPPAEDRDS
jgi:hypothetical protein